MAQAFLLQKLHQHLKAHLLAPLIEVADKATSKQLLIAGPLATSILVISSLNTSITCTRETSRKNITYVSNHRDHRQG